MRLALLDTQTRTPPITSSPSNTPTIVLVGTFTDLLSAHLPRCRLYARLGTACQALCRPKVAVRNRMTRLPDDRPSTNALIPRHGREVFHVQSVVRSHRP